MLLVRQSILAKNLFTRINRSIVCLIIDDQQGKMCHDLATGLCLDGVGYMIDDPLVQTFKDFLILLDNKQPRSLFRRNPEILRGGHAEVTFFGTCCCVVRANRRIPVNQTDTDRPGFVTGRVCLIPQKPLIKTHLSLRAQIVVHSSQNNDDLVTSISRLADQPGIVARFA
ncbi:hypothetical protein D3C72_1499850 [compost metagenome]